MKCSLGRSLLENPEQLPLRSPAEIAADGATLIVAPHPDDESLGCGGAIALLCQYKCPVQVLVVSDGTLSHPNSRRYPVPALQALREAEVLAAATILGVAPQNVTCLRLKDGSIPFPDTPEFTAALQRVKDYLATHPPQTVFLPWRYDPHPDHRASWQLLFAAITELNLLPRLIEYPIWDWDSTQRSAAPLPAQVTPWRLDITDVLPLKQKAIAAHRSQTTDLIDDDPQGFRLAPEMLACFAKPWELYLETQTPDLNGNRA